MEELKKCPFCDCEAVLREYEDKKTDSVWYTVRCSNPSCVGFFIEPQYELQTTAISKWNRRDPEKHSWWTKSAEGYKICNRCKADVAIFSDHRNYCPNCGAKMDGDMNE